MQVDRPVADCAAARQTDRRFARAANQRPEHEDRRAHLADDVIGRGGAGQPPGAQRHHPAEILRPRSLHQRRDAELVEQVPETVDIGEPRQEVGGRSRLPRYAFSIVHCNGCWFSRAKSITCVTFVSATSYEKVPQMPTPF